MFNSGPDARSKLTIFVEGVAVCLSLLGGAPMVAAQSLDLDAGSNKPADPPRSSVGGLDMDANPDKPLPGQPAAVAPASDSVQAGITPLGPKVIPTPGGDAGSPLPTAPEPTSSPDQANAQPPPPEPVKLDHPKVIDTAKLQAGETTVTLFGIEGLAGAAAQGLQGYLGQGDGHLTCQAHEGAAFVCLTADGTDVALVALRNGAARSKAEAPDVYREQENLAQADRRGIWANLPPPPETVKHPVVKDTATLTAENKTYILNGVVGLAAPYSGQLQSYIVSNGDSMTCLPQGPRDQFVCLMPDGTDLAKVVLVNGAARAAPGVPESYRTQQLEALNNHRGYWATASQDVVATAMQAPPPGAQYTFIAGDEGADGISYVGGAPVAVIEGEPAPVFLVYGDDDLGWGYYDHDHHWRRAPDRYWRHLDHFHHAGEGLRGYERGRFVAAGHEFVGRPGLEGHPGMPGGVHEVAMHSEAHAAMHEGGFRPEGRGYESHEIARPSEPMGHLAGREPMEQHLSGPVAGHPGFPGAGGGFMRPNPMASAGGFHPGGMAAPMRAAAPAPRAAPAGGGGGRHK